MAREKLVQLLIEHGVRAYERHGHIFAYDLYSDLGGFVHERIVELRPSLKAIRDFLEY